MAMYACMHMYAGSCVLLLSVVPIYRGNYILGRTQKPSETCRHIDVVCLQVDTLQQT